MTIIAIEEAFALPYHPQEGPVLQQTILPETLECWNKSLPDFTDLRLKDMDQNGVSVQVLSLTCPGIQGIADSREAVQAAKQANDFLAAQIKQNPKRYRGFAALPLQDPAAAVEELKRCVRELGFCGALINDHTNGHYMDEPQFDVVWSALEELDVPLYIHPGAPKADKWHLLDGYPSMGGAFWAWGAEVGGHAMRIIFGGVFDRHPKAKLILGHMGEFLPFQLWRLDSRYKTFKDQKLKKMPSEYYRQNVSITTSGVFDPAALAGALAALGEDSILFSIDYPYESSKQAVEFLHSAPISESVREKLAWKNAARLLKLEV